MQKFCIAVVLKNLQDGSNAETANIIMTPNYDKDLDAPKTWEEAFALGRRVAERYEKTIPSEGVCEIRITTFQQNTNDDHLVSRVDYNEKDYPEYEEEEA